ncbi:TIGR02206 family membrane protein [Alkalibacillus sp. S2W]|uniref:YwaF family protein n=1 Tax=Alkalibacillus sp. S2W TaxID=3386553 RepID=UPI00398CFBF5
MRELVTMDRELYPFDLFGVPHMVALLFCLAIIWSLYHFRNTLRIQSRKLWRYSLIAILLIGEISFHVWYVAYGDWDLSVNLPLQLSSISVYLVVFMLLLKRRWLFEITFFIGVTGGLIATMTPELFFGFPHIRFFQFFIVHAAIVVGCFYMLFVERMALSWTSVLKSFLALNVIAVIVFMVNGMLGANYMFLNNKPSQATLIDFLGPYPWYIVTLEVLAFTLFCLIFLLVSKQNK